MLTKIITIVALLAGDLILKASPAGGVSTVIWVAQTQEQFRQGEPKGVSLTPAGEVLLAPPLELLSSTEEPYVWCLAKDRRGNIYAGTGNGGKVFKIAKGKTSLHFDPPGTQIYSLAVGPQDHLYVGSSPEGIVYKVTPDGRSSQFFKADERYVWSMAFDRRGNLYVGCGEKGKIYSVNQEGEGKLLYDSEERHALCLLWDRGNLYAGTEGRGLVYEITPQGEGRGIFDPPQGEVIRLLIHPSGDLYAAATKGYDILKEGKKGQKSANVIGSLTAQGEKSALYRVSADGPFSKVWSSESHHILSLGLARERVLVGTGDEGRSYLVDPDEGETDLFQCEEAQILSLLQEGGETCLGTGNTGRVYRMGQGYRREGEFISKAQDTGTISKWGRISWTEKSPLGTEISLQTRTGNTSEADNTWSAWSREYSNGSRIESPPARFIQWRATLSTSNQQLSPALSAVLVAYLPQNLPPTITLLSVLPPGVGAASKDGVKRALLSAERKKALTERGLSLPDQVYELERGLRSLHWKAEDANGDSLVFTVYFKGHQEREWKILKEDIKTTDFTFDSFSLPDGHYRVKLVASDLPDNPEGTALSVERASESFVVDNSAPQVESPRVDSKGREVMVKAEDSLSPLLSCQYSIDGGEWRSLFPLDGIFDSKTEEFRFEVERLLRGEHTIAVKVTDRSLNVGSSKKVFYIR